MDNIKICIFGTVRPVLYVNGKIDKNSDNVVIYSGKRIFFSTKNKHRFKGNFQNDNGCFNISGRIFFLNRQIKVYKEINGQKFLIEEYKERFLKVLINRLFRKLNNDLAKSIERDYLKWMKNYEVSTKNKKFNYSPLISIIIPVYDVKSSYLSECIDSILNQRYSNFEICIADDCSTNVSTIKTLKKYEKQDERIKIIYRKSNGHISRASNSAMSLATGEFVGLLDHDDILSPNALYEVVKALNANQDIDFLYSDEDKLNKNGRRCSPHFKPDWSPELLMSYNYLCHFSVIRKTIVDDIGGFRKGFEGAQDYDLFLRISEKTNRIYHIPKILYHWRMIEGSTANKNDEKDYAQQAGKKALEDALSRRNLKGTVVFFQSHYIVEYDNNNPLISIIIPTKDHALLLNKCITSIYEKTTYKNFEIVIVDNNSNEEATFELFKEYQKKYSNIKIISLECEFNFSYLNNEAVKISCGEYLVLLNNDTEIITHDWLEKMVGYASLKHVGCVGVKLLYNDYTIQHGGIIIGLNGVAGHAYVGCANNYSGYFSKLQVPSNVSAVTAACLMISKKKYNEVRGLDTDLKVSFNDVDFNMKILSKYYNVFLPNVEVFHLESKTRGYDNTKEKQEIALKEMNFMYNKWGDQITNDSFYNENFSKKQAYRLK